MLPSVNAELVIFIVILRPPDITVGVSIEEDITKVNDIEIAFMIDSMNRALENSL